MTAMNHNWGRWGAEDERGTLNLLTPDVVRAAAGAVRTGRVLGLSQPIRGATSNAAARRVAHLRGRPLPQHFMSVDGGDYAAGARAVGAGLRVADDALMLSPHGTTTHMDALCHMWSGDELYNGHPAARVRSYGAGRCGIDAALPGVVARGVLLDAAGLRGVPRLGAADRVDAAALAACARRAGVTVGAGDVAIVRTGWPTAYDTDPELYWSGQPGLTGDAGRWLAERDVAMVACDNAAISGLGADQSAAEPAEDDLHLTLLWRAGVHIAEMLWLEELARAGRAEFLFVAAPLAVAGGTASPINPLAIL